MKVAITDKHGERIISNILVQEQESPVTYHKHSFATAEKYWTSSAMEIRAGKSYIVSHDIDVKEPVSVKTYDAPEKTGLIFLEQGAIRVKQSDKSFREIGTLQHNLIYNAQQTDETFFSPQQKLRITIIEFSPDDFFKLAEGGSTAIDRMAATIYKGNGPVFANDKNLQITNAMLRLLHAFDSSMYNNASLRLYTEAKILELLSLQIAQIEEDSRGTALSGLSQSDIRKLNTAREFILTDLSSTPSLEDISLAAGINLYKLKTGFKALFGQSVFNYLREERLILGYKEATKRSLSLTEIAYLTGFASISHFSDAFKKRYGIAPSQLR